MAPGLIKTLLGQGGMHKTLSFEDFSLGTAAEAEESLSPQTKDVSPIMTMATSPTAPGTPPAAASTGGFSPAAGARGWASVFNPGRNNNPAARSPGSNFYDHVHQAGDDARPVWDEVIKAERVRTLQDVAAKMGPKSQPMNAHDLCARLGGGEEVKQMVAAADKDGSGSINYAELTELIRNS